MDTLSDSGEIKSVCHESTYICTLYFISSTFLKLGEGSGEILAQQKIEVGYVCILMMTSTVLYNIYLGHLTNIMHYMSFRSLNFYGKFLELKRFLKANCESQNLVNQTEKYTLYLWREARGLQLPYFVTEAPYFLRNKIMSAAYMSHLTKNHIFRDCEPVFLRQLVAFMQPYYYDEYMYVVRGGEITNAMYFVHKGIIQELIEDRRQETRSLTPGTFFGGVHGLYRNIPYKYSYMAEIKSQVLTLPFDSWEYLLTHFPGNLKHIYGNIDDPRKKKQIGKMPGKVRTFPPKEMRIVHRESLEKMDQPLDLPITDIEVLERQIPEMSDNLKKILKEIDDNLTKQEILHEKERLRERERFEIEKETLFRDRSEEALKKLRRMGSHDSDWESSENLIERTSQDLKTKFKEKESPLDTEEGPKRIEPLLGTAPAMAGAATAGAATDGVATAGAATAGAATAGVATAGAATAGAATAGAATAGAATAGAATAGAATAGAATAGAATAGAAMAGAAMAGAAGAIATGAVIAKLQPSSMDSNVGVEIKKLGEVDIQKEDSVVVLLSESKSFEENETVKTETIDEEQENISLEEVELRNISSAALGETPSTASDDDIASLSLSISDDKSSISASADNIKDEQYEEDEKVESISTKEILPPQPSASSHDEIYKEDMPLVAEKDIAEPKDLPSAALQDQISSSSKPPVEQVELKELPSAALQEQISSSAKPPIEQVELKDLTSPLSTALRDDTQRKKTSLEDVQSGKIESMADKDFPQTSAKPDFPKPEPTIKESKMPDFASSQIPADDQPYESPNETMGGLPYASRRRKTVIGVIKETEEDDFAGLKSESTEEVTAIKLSDLEELKRIKPIQTPSETLTKEEEMFSADNELEEDIEEEKPEDKQKNKDKK